MSSVGGEGAHLVAMLWGRGAERAAVRKGVAGRGKGGGGVQPAAENWKRMTAA